jgi:hypothetical protein
MGSLQTKQSSSFLSFQLGSITIVVKNIPNSNKQFQISQEWKSKFSTLISSFPKPSSFTGWNVKTRKTKLIDFEKLMVITFPC